MNRSTLWLLVTAAALAVLTWFMTRKPETEAPQRLQIAGYATPEQLEAEKSRGLMDEPVRIASPIDEVVIAWPGRPVIELKRQGDGEGAIWEMIAPQKGVAQTHVVEQIVGLFKSPTLSREARRYHEADARLYGFEPERKLRITLKSNGSVWNGVDLYIGDVRKARGSDEAREPPDTWVMKADDANWAFAVSAKDLRTALDRKVADLRDKKVFRFKSEDLVSLRVEPPGGTTVILRAEVTPAGDAANGADVVNGANGAPTWSISEPAGVTMDASARTFVRSVAELRAQSFEPVAGAPPEAGASLGGAVWRFVLTTKDGNVVTMQVGTGAGDPGWARIDGSDEYVALSSHTIKTITKGLEDLRDRTVMTFDVATIDRVALRTAEGDVVVSRSGDGWVFGAPVLNFAADPTRWLTTLKGAQALRWARPDEVAVARAALADNANATVVKLGVAGAPERTTIRFGPVFELDGQTVRWGGIDGGEPFIISDFHAKKADATIADLRPRKLVAWPLEEIARVSVAMAGETAFTLARDPETKGFGIIEPAGATAGDPENLVRAIVGLEARGFETEAWDKASAAATARGTVTVTHTSGATLTLRVAKRGEDADPLLAADSGPLSGAVVSVNRWELDHLLKMPTPPTP